MKLIAYIAVFVLLFSFASAAVSIEESSVTFKVDYSGFTDEDQDTVTVSTETFTLSSDEDITITISADLPENYEVDEKDVALIASEEKQVTLTLRAPHKQDVGIKTVGKIQVKDSSDNLLASADLKQETASMLEFNRLSVSYVNTEEKSKKDRFNGDDEQYVLEDDVKPNTEVVLEFELRNLFDNDYDQDDGQLEDVELHIEADDNDLLPDDFQEDYSLGDIEADSKIVETIRFALNPDADSAVYTLEFTVEAQDGKGYNYEIYKELELEIVLLRDDIRITVAEIQPVDACESSLTLDLALKNFGSRDQDYVAVRVYNQELGINKEIRNIPLEENGNDDSWSQSLTFNNLDLVAKTYSLDITTYIDNDEAIGFERLNFAVGSCSNEQNDEPGEEIPKDQDKENNDSANGSQSNSDPTETPKNEADKIGSSTIVSSVEDPYTNDDYLVSIMVVGIIMTLAIIGMFTFILVKKK